MIQLGDVRIFLEVVTGGSFSEAARRLKMPKSSVTRQIDRLEATLGGKLFRRTTRSVALTAEGRDFLPCARRLFDNGMEAQHILQSTAVSASGLLTISATAPFARRFLVPHLPEFQARHPNVQIALWLGCSSIQGYLFSRPIEGEAVLAMIAGPMSAVA